jgi:hypothetical protein
LESRPPAAGSSWQDITACPLTARCLLPAYRKADLEVGLYERKGRSLQRM